MLEARRKISGGLLRWLGFEAFGDPAWQIGDELALHFDEPIDAAWLIETRQRAPVELDHQAPRPPRRARLRQRPGELRALILTLPGWHGAAMVALT